MNMESTQAYKSAFTLTCILKKKEKKKSIHVIQNPTIY